MCEKTICDKYLNNYSIEKLASEYHVGKLKIKEILNKNNIKLITSRCSYGGGCINDTIMHLVGSNIPFGGVGASGMGNYSKIKKRYIYHK